MSSNIPDVNTTLHELILRKRKKLKQEYARKKVISSGITTNALNLICFLTALLFGIAHFEHLQADSDYQLLDFDISIFNGFQHEFFRKIIQYGDRISIAMLLIHILAIKFSTTRFTFTSLLAFFVWPINTLLHFEQNHSHDYLICRLAFSAFTILIMASILLLPKKMKRKKQSNNFYSAFSIESTPGSQQSLQNISQCSHMNGNGKINFDDSVSLFSDKTTTTNGFRSQMRKDINDNYSIYNGNGDDCMSIRSGAFSSEPRFRQSSQNMSQCSHTNGNGKIVFDDNISLFSHKTSTTNGFQNQSGTVHDWLSLSSRKKLKDFNTENMFGQQKNLSQWREKRRESTPIREVRNLINDLIIDSADDDE